MIYAVVLEPTWLRVDGAPWISDAHESVDLALCGSFRIFLTVAVHPPALVDTFPDLDDEVLTSFNAAESMEHEHVLQTLNEELEGIQRKRKVLILQMKICLEKINVLEHFMAVQRENESIFGTFLDKLKMVENLERAELNRRKAEVRTVGIGALRAELELRKLQIENLKIRKETSGRETLKLLEQQEIHSTVLTDEYKVRSLVARKTSLVRISAELSHQAAAEAVERVARGLECTRKLLEHSTNELVQARKQLEAKNERMTELDLRRMCGFRKKFRAEDQLFWPTQMERKRQTKRQDVSRGVDFTRPP